MTKRSDWLPIIAGLCWWSAAAMAVYLTIIFGWRLL